MADTPLRKKVIEIALKAEKALKELGVVEKALGALDKTVSTVASSIEKSADKMAAAFSRVSTAAGNVKQNLPSGGGGGGGGRGGGSGPRAPKGDYGAGNKFKGGAGRGRGELDGLDKTDWEKTSKGISGVGSAAASAGKGLGSMAVAAGSLVATGVIGLVSALAGGLKDAASQAIDFEKSLTGIAKVLDDKSSGAIKQVENDIKELSTTLGFPPEEVADIAQALAANGPKMQAELKARTEDAIKLGVAFDLTGAEAGHAISSLTASLGLSRDELNSLLGTVNKLDDGMNSSSKDLVKYLEEVGGIGKAASISGESMLALGSAVISTGVAPDKAATGVKNFIATLEAGSAATDKQVSAFTKLGFEAEEVAKQMASGNAESQIKAISAAIGTLPKEERFGVLIDLFGRESIGSVGGLATNVDLLGDAFKIAGDKAGAAASIQAEFDRVSDTTAHRLEKLKAQASVFAIELGDKLLPHIVTVAEWLSSPEIQELGQKALAGLSEGAAFVSEKFEKAWETLGPFIEALAGGLYSAFQTVWPIIVSVAGSIQDLATTILESLGLAGEEGGEAATGLATTLQNVLVTALTAVKVVVDTVKEAIEFLSPVITTVVEYIKNVASGAFDVLTSTVSGLSTMVTGLVDAFTDLGSGNITAGLLKLGKALINGLLEPLKAIIRQVINLADSIPGPNIVPDALREFADMGPKSIQGIDDDDAQAGSSSSQTSSGGGAGYSYIPDAPAPAAKGGTQGAVAPTAPTGGSKGGGSGKGKKGKGKGKKKYGWETDPDAAEERWDWFVANEATLGPADREEWNKLAKHLNRNKPHKLSKAEKQLAGMDPALRDVLMDPTTGKLSDDPLSKAAAKKRGGHDLGVDSPGSGGVGAGPSISNTYNNQTVTTTVTQQIDARGNGGSAVDNIRSVSREAATNAANVAFTGISQVLGLKNAGGILK